MIKIEDDRDIDFTDGKTLPVFRVYHKDYFDHETKFLRDDYNFTEIKIDIRDEILQNVSSASAYTTLLATCWYDAPSYDKEDIFSFSSINDVVLPDSNTEVECHVDEDGLTLRIYYVPHAVLYPRFSGDEYDYDYDYVYESSAQYLGRGLFHIIPEIINLSIFDKDINSLMDIKFAIIPMDEGDYIDTYDYKNGRCDAFYSPLYTEEELKRGLIAVDSEGCIIEGKYIYDGPTSCPIDVVNKFGKYTFSCTNSALAYDFLIWNGEHLKREDSQIELAPGIFIDRHPIDWKQIDEVKMENFKRATDTHDSFGELKSGEYY